MTERGRPSLLNDELIKRIEMLVSEGVPPDTAALQSGVSRRNFNNWMQWGKQHIHTDEASQYRDLFERLDAARSAYLADVIKKGNKLIFDGKYTSVKDIVLWLERQDPDHFRKRESVEIAGQLNSKQTIEHLTTPEDENGRLADTLSILESLGRIPRLRPASEVIDVVATEVDEVHTSRTESEAVDLPESD